MQPYFLPYIGYFQLIASVDQFIVYDNIKYTKKGWINRNRWLQNGTGATFTLPLVKDSDFLNIDQRSVSADFEIDTFLSQLRGNYVKAPFFATTYALVEQVLPGENRNLFAVLLHSLHTLCRHLDISTEINVSSALDADHTLKGQDRVLDLCLTKQGTTYINSIGGAELYSAHDFAGAGLNLRFLRSQPLAYKQFGAPFVPWLSIVDVLMFNPLETVRGYLSEYDLINGTQYV